MANRCLFCHYLSVAKYPQNKITLLCRLESKGLGRILLLAKAKSSKNFCNVALPRRFYLIFVDTSLRLSNDDVKVDCFDSA